VTDSERAPENNAFKRPYLMFLAVLGRGFATVGIVQGSALVAAAGLITDCGGVVVLYATRGGRNPKWLRSRLDRMPPGGGG
jgi:hypothetical protein